METPNIVQSALAASREAAQVQVAQNVTNAKPFVVLRGADGGQKVEYVEEHFDAPTRKIALVKMHDAESFIAYWKKHKTDASSIYGSMTASQFLAVFDDHGTEGADYREHRAIYKLEHSKEYKEWTSRDRQDFEGNEKFALWLENHLPDIVKPEGARLLEIALNFRVNENAAFANAMRLQDGNTEFTYTNNVEGSSKVDAKKVKIPEEIEINIPVYDGLMAQQYKFAARFRYRLNNGKLTLRYELIRHHKVVEQAFKHLLDKINKAAGCEVLFGSPE